MLLLRRNATLSSAAILLWITAATLLYSGVARAQDSTSPINEQQVKLAMKKLKEDPNLAEKQKIKTLHWMDADKKDKEEKKEKTPGWLHWVRDAFSWLSHTSRLLLWIVIGALIAAVVIFLLRIFGNYQRSSRVPLINLPTHVRDLDIRPESLPDDIGAAVWQLWQRNEHRTALALLYRGLLSRLVHQHAVPIKDSSTESQCLELARAHLRATQTEYVARTFRVWQFAVYGAQLPATDQVQYLCERFAAEMSNMNIAMEGTS